MTKKRLFSIYWITTSKSLSYYKLLLLDIENLQNNFTFCIFHPSIAIPYNDIQSVLNI